MRLLTILSFLFTLVLCSSALGGITVFPMVLHFPPKEITADLTVTNQDKNHVAYVSIEPKTAEPKKILNPKELGYLIAPSKLTIPPASSRLVRIRLIEPPGDKEHRYEIVVKPVEGELVFAKTNQPDIKAGVRVIVAYGVLLIVPPINPQIKMTLVRENQSLTAFNRGNTTVELNNGKQCSDLHSCQRLPSYYIKPGEKKIIKLPLNTSATFIQRSGNNSTEVHSN